MESTIYKMSDKKLNVYVALTALYCVMLIVTNILANRTFEVWEFMLPSAVIAFPVIYIVNDIMTECYGFKLASKVIITAFCLNLIAVIVFNLAIQLPTTIDYGAYNIVLGNTLLPLVASVTAYLVGSFVNAKVMDIMKNGKSLFVRCVLSTLFGETLDAAIFITIVFIGVMPFEVVLTMIATQAIFKTAYEIVVYPITRKVIGAVKALD